MVHQFKNNGYNIALDENSGSVHVVDDMTYDVLECISDGADKNETISRLTSKYDAKEISEALDEIDELKNEGALYTEDIYKNAVDIFKDRKTVVKALCLHIAHDCNLACK